jgi:hypothetical protein
MVLEKILEFCQYWTIFALSEIYPFIKKVCQEDYKSRAFVQMQTSERN